MGLLRNNFVAVVRVTLLVDLIHPVKRHNTKTIQNKETKNIYGEKEKHSEK